MLKLSLKDSRYIDSIKYTSEECIVENNLGIKVDKKIALLQECIDKLNKEIQDRNKKIINLDYTLNRKQSKDEDGEIKIVWYGETQYENFYKNRSIPQNCKFYTSHFIGSYMTHIDDSNGNSIPVTIEIKPRFGEAILTYLLSYVKSLHVFGRNIQYDPKKGDYTYWLLQMLWKSALNRAISQNHIPRDYVLKEENRRSIKGRIDFAKQMKNNLIDQSKTYCRYKELTYNNTINRAILYSYELLCRNQPSLMLNDLSPFISKLKSLGVSEEAVTLEDIDSINYTKMNESYMQLMEICRYIISYNMPDYNMISSGIEGNSFFVDIAELWENYIYNVLQKNLSDKYEIISPNYLNSDTYYLLKNKEGREARRIIPDFLIKKNNEIVAVIDAKYKRHDKLNEVSKEDIYQMTTYLLKFSLNNQKNNQNILGIFVCPNDYSRNNDMQKPDIQMMQNNEKIKLGLVNFNVLANSKKESNGNVGTIALDIEKQKDNEKYFVEELESLLEEQSQTLNAPSSS